MSVVIRMARMGAKGKPHHKIVVTEKTSPRDGRFIEQIGVYDPSRTPAFVQLDAERAAYWIGKGAQPSETVRSLIKRQRKNSAAAA